MDAMVKDSVGPEAILTHDDGPDQPSVCPLFMEETGEEDEELRNTYRRCLSLRNKFLSSCPVVESSHAIALENAANEEPVADVSEEEDSSYPLVHEHFQGVVEKLHALQVEIKSSGLDGIRSIKKKSDDISEKFSSQKGSIVPSETKPFSIQSEDHFFSPCFPRSELLSPGRNEVASDSDVQTSSSYAESKQRILCTSRYDASLRSNLDKDSNYIIESLGVSSMTEKKKDRVSMKKSKSLDSSPCASRQSSSHGSSPSLRGKKNPHPKPTSSSPSCVLQLEQCLSRSSSEEVVPSQPITPRVSRTPRGGGVMGTAVAPPRPVKDDVPEFSDMDVGYRSQAERNFWHFESQSSADYVLSLRSSPPVKFSPHRKTVGETVMEAQKLSCLSQSSLNMESKNVKTPPTTSSPLIHAYSRLLGSDSNKSNFSGVADDTVSISPSPAERSFWINQRLSPADADFIVSLRSSNHDSPSSNRGTVSDSRVGSFSRSVFSPRASRIENSVDLCSDVVGNIFRATSPDAYSSSISSPSMKSSRSPTSRKSPSHSRKKGVPSTRSRSPRSEHEQSTLEDYDESLSSVWEERETISPHGDKIRYWRNRETGRASFHFPELELPSRRFHVSHTVPSPGTKGSSSEQSSPAACSPNCAPLDLSTPDDASSQILSSVSSLRDRILSLRRNTEISRPDSSQKKPLRDVIGSFSADDLLSYFQNR